MMHNEDKNISILKPSREKIKISGKLMYNEGSQAWNLMRLKKPFLDDFPDLKQKRGAFGYLMIKHHTFEDLKKEILELEKQEEAVPCLFYVCRKKV